MSDSYSVPPIQSPRTEDRILPAVVYGLFLIRTFWTAVVWSIIGGLVIGVGGLLMVILIGFPIFHLGVAILGLATIWFFVRTLVGAIYLVQDQAYPRPRTWLL